MFTKTRGLKSRKRHIAHYYCTYYCVTLISWLSLSFPEFLH